MSKKFFIFYLSIIILGILALPLFPVQAADRLRCTQCLCTYSLTGEQPIAALPIVEGMAEEVNALCVAQCETVKQTSDGVLVLGRAKSDSCITLAPPATIPGSTEEEEGEEGEEGAGANKLPGGLVNPLGTTSIPQLIGRVIKAILGIVGSIALLMFIWGGFLWMTAAGEAKKVEKGKETLVWATVGLATIFFAYAAVSFVIGAITSEGGETPGTEGAVTGFCICQYGTNVDKYKAYDRQEDVCESSTDLTCKWVYGACKRGDLYFPNVTNKNDCESLGAGSAWYGETP